MEQLGVGVSSVVVLREWPLAQGHLSGGKGCSFDPRPDLSLVNCGLVKALGHHLKLRRQGCSSRCQSKHVYSVGYICTQGELHAVAA